jgi:polysaccharide biosynthesis protein PslH
MRILQLAPQFPFPENDGGKIGIANTFKQLSKFAEVTFFCYANNLPQKEQLDIAEKFGKVIIFEHNTSNSPTRILTSIFDKTPLYIKKHNSNLAFDKIIDLMREERYDVIHADHTAMAPLALRLKAKFDTPVGLRLHNVEHLIWDRYEQAIPFYHPKKWYVKSQASKLKKYEADILNQCTINFPITDEDLKNAKGIAPNSNCVVAGPGINLSNWKRNEVKKIPKALIHATTYNWIHNIDAVRWFINKVMPKLVEKYSDINLQLTGSKAPKDFYGRPSVEVLGFVPQILPYLSSASIYVAPLFVGGGVRIKILEAMAMELPVVASSISAEGIKAGKDNGLIIANNADEFVEEITFLIDNPEIAENLGKKARQYVLDNYSWEKSIGVIYNCYKNILNC